jgi:copper chaperone
MKTSLIVVFLMLFAAFLAGCGKSDNKQTESKNQNQTTTSDQKTTELQVSGDDKAVTIQCSGMTCTGCETSVKGKVKQINGVKDVIADYKTNVVKASYDPAKTNVDAIKAAIADAGFNVESVK